MQNCFICFCCACLCCCYYYTCCCFCVCFHFRIYSSLKNFTFFFFLFSSFLFFSIFLSSCSQFNVCCCCTFINTRLLYLSFSLDVFEVIKKIHVCIPFCYSVMSHSIDTHCFSTTLRAHTHFSFFRMPQQNYSCMLC